MSSTRANVDAPRTILAAVQLAASSAWTASSVVSIEGARGALLGVAATGAASASGALWEARAVGAFAQATAPAIGDNVWYDLTVFDGTVAPTTIAAGTLPTGFDITSLTLGFGLVKPYPTLIRPPAAYAATNVDRKGYPLNVAGYSYLCVMFREIGDTTNRTTLEAKLVTFA